MIHLNIQLNAMFKDNGIAWMYRQKAALPKA